MAKKVFIYGGCVTRDVFTKDFDRNSNFEVIAYFARYSLARVPFDPVLDVPEIFLSSNFQKKTLIQEMKNLLISSLALSDYDFIIFDFLTIRFSIIYYSGTYLTESLELSNSGVLKKNNSKRLGPEDELFWYFWEKGLSMVVENLKRLNKLDKMYIQRLYWATHDCNGDHVLGQENILKQNEYLDRAYKIAEKYVSSGNFINYDENLFICDPNHKWGAAPIHYIKDFYSKSFSVFECISNSVYEN